MPANDFSSLLTANLSLLTVARAASRFASRWIVLSSLVEEDVSSEPDVLDSVLVVAALVFLAFVAFFAVVVSEGVVEVVVSVVLVVVSDGLVVVPAVSVLLVGDVVGSAVL